MTKKRVLVCDDQQRFLDAFRERHQGSYDIITVLDSQSLMNTIDGPDGIPDIVLLDLYFPYDNNPDSGNKIPAAEKSLKQLDEQIAASKQAVMEAWEPRGVALLKKIRDKYPASLLPVVIFTQKGLFFLDDDQIREVEVNSGHWLLKGQLSALTEEVRINRILSSDAAVSRPEKVFIGHGRNQVWRDLKDYLHDQLGLQWNELTRETASAVSTFDRLSPMLKSTMFAFIIMTREDEHDDPSMPARENIIYEIGLLQGSLGLRKVVVLLEEGCHEFSNIIGLSQMRFPSNNISAAFKEIGRVLKPEGIAKK